MGLVPGSVRILEVRPPLGSLTLSLMPAIICHGMDSMRIRETGCNFKRKSSNQRMGFRVSSFIERFKTVHNGDERI